MKYIKGAAISAAVLAATLALAAIWWFGGGIVNTRDYNNNVDSQAFQAGLVAQARGYADGWNAATDAGQKAQIASRFCTVVQDITLVPADLATDKMEICS